MMREAELKRVDVYVDREGRALFSEWLSALKDRAARARIRVRIDRPRLGTPGDCRALGGGVRELRVDHGPGYRVYFAEAADRIVLLLCGGDKRTQARDVERARACWADYGSRDHGKE